MADFQPLPEGARGKNATLWRFLLLFLSLFLSTAKAADGIPLPCVSCVRFQHIRNKGDGAM